MVLWFCGYVVSVVTRPYYYIEGCSFVIISLLMSAATVMFDCDYLFDLAFIYLFTIYLFIYVLIYIYEITMSARTVNIIPILNAFL